MGRKPKSNSVKKKPKGSAKSKGKKDYVQSWPDDKIEEVWEGHEKGEYQLGAEDLKILKSELEKRKLGPFKSSDKKEKPLPGSELFEDEEEEQVPLGYIKLYLDDVKRNEFYRKRYENARKAWGTTTITQKGETWFIVSKGDDEFGYDVHLFFTRDRMVHGTCTCQDFTQRGSRRNFPCKHIFMVLVDQKLAPKWLDKQ
jgi:hypothetical protein